MTPKTKSPYELFPIGARVRVLPCGVHALTHDPFPTNYHMGIVGLKGKVTSRDSMFVRVTFPINPQVPIARFGLDLLFEPHELEVL